MAGGRVWKSLVTAGLVGLATVALTLIIGHESPAATPVTSSSAASEGEAFVYLFDSVSETFVFTFRIPTADANPKDVLVAGDRDEVWFTESGAGRIGRLTYTDTTDYRFEEFRLAEGSSPENLVIGGGYVWFTEPRRDRIGRLDMATGEVDEFEVPVGAYPADLDYASDGSIWFTMMMSDGIGRLVVTAADDYVVEEYFDESLAGGRPYGLVVAGTNTVYFAQTENDRVSRFTPPNSWLHLYDSSGATDAPNGPYKVALEKWDEVWTTERDGNRITKFKPGTLPLPIPRTLTPSHSVPMGLAVERSSGQVWFTQWAAGQIGRFVPGVGIEYYSLPVAALMPTGIATDGAGDVWVLASRPYKLHLPLIARSGG